VVAAELSRWYDVDVRLEGAGLGAQQLTAEFHNEPITKVIPMVQASLGLKLRQSGRQYVLSLK
jgi:ferric-dicitrate binding protein FerR (iron transport regulator)